MPGRYGRAGHQYGPFYVPVHNRVGIFQHLGLKMKIAVYSIAKNEEQHVDRYVESAKDADAIYVLDTGSTDNTVEALRAHGVSVHQKTFDPWRFDRARNAAMDLVPDDYQCLVWRDFDEEMIPARGWRLVLEQNWDDDPCEFYARYVSSRRPDGTPDLEYWRSMAHSRHFRWIHPVHEVLKPKVSKYRTAYLASLTIDHQHRDEAKDRTQYLHLLALAVHENPGDDRNAHYYARELYYYKQWDAAITEFNRHLSLNSSKWAAERAASLRFMARCYSGKGDAAAEEQCYLRACAECPWERDPWVDLAQYYNYYEQWAGVYYAAKKALAVPVASRGNHYLTSAYAWKEGPHDLICVAATKLGRIQEAEAAAFEAWRQNRADQRLKANVQWFIDRKAKDAGNKAVLESTETKG